MRRLGLAFIAVLALTACKTTVASAPALRRGAQATALLEERIAVAADIGRLFHEQLARAHQRFANGRAPAEEVAELEIRAREARLHELALQQELAEGR